MSSHGILQKPQHFFNIRCISPTNPGFLNGEKSQEKGSMKSVGVGGLVKRVTVHGLTDSVVLTGWRENCKLIPSDAN